MPLESHHIYDVTFQVYPLHPSVCVYEYATSDATYVFLVELLECLNVAVPPFLRLASFLYTGYEDMNLTHTHTPHLIS